MHKDSIVYLQHILLECDFIVSVIRPETSKDEFISDEVLKRAVVRSLEIIGEATKKIPADNKLEWKDISWKNMAGMRDRLIHDYMGVNYSIVWDVVKNIIPKIRVEIQEIVQQNGK
jgi:uncharacterized protein with HEPN domain